MFQEAGRSREFCLHFKLKSHGTLLCVFILRLRITPEPLVYRKHLVVKIRNFGAEFCSCVAFGNLWPWIPQCQQRMERRVKTPPRTRATYLTLSAAHSNPFGKNRQLSCVGYFLSRTAASWKRRTCPVQPLSSNSSYFPQIF